MKLYRLLLVPTLLLAIGCSHIPKQSALALGNGYTPEGQKLLLSSPEDQRSELETFLARHDKVSEENQIQYLLSRIETSKYSFIRNSEVFDGPSAMKWLRWKRGHRQYRNNPIRTARDFIDRVADRSKNTGLPYETVIEGKHHRLDSILNNELEALDMAIQVKSLQEHLSENLPQEAKTSSDLPSPIPIAGPAVRS